MNLVNIFEATLKDDYRPILQYVHGVVNGNKMILECTDGSIVVRLLLDTEIGKSAIFDSFNLDICDRKDFLIEKGKKFYSFLEIETNGPYPVIGKVMPDITFGDKTALIKPESMVQVYKILSCFYSRKELTKKQIITTAYGANNSSFVFIDTDYVRGIIMIMGFKAPCDNYVEKCNEIYSDLRKIY